MTTALKNSIAKLGNQLDAYKKDAQLAVVAVGNFVPYARQARTRFDEDLLRELAESFKEVGILEPLLVRPIGNGKYEIIAGERRLRAAVMAGLSGVPVLIRQMDDELADKIHLAENVHRENLSNLELAERVQRDLEAAGGDLAVVAAKYNKGKPWVSKLASIAGGGETMTELVDQGVTSDRAVLATVASLERKAPERAKELSEQLKAAPAKSNKRAITDKFMKGAREERASTRAAEGSKKKQPQKAGPSLDVGAEPAWRSEAAVDREIASAKLVVELSPASPYIKEFNQLSKRGLPCLVLNERHPKQQYALVEFGTGAAVERRTYRADELRLISIF